MVGERSRWRHEEEDRGVVLTSDAPGNEEKRWLGRRGVEVW
jgi:hypothetical protein